MLEAYRVGVSLLMDTGITSQLSAIIAQFEKLDAVVRRVNAANKNMADVVRGMNNVGAGMGGIAAASEKMAKAASDISRVMPDVTRQAEATAAAMERAASASQRLLTGPASMLALPAPYSSSGTGFHDAGQPLHPIRLHAERTADQPAGARLSTGAIQRRVHHGRWQWAAIHVDAATGLHRSERRVSGSIAVFWRRHASAYSAGRTVSARRWRQVVPRRDRL